MSSDTKTKACVKLTFCDDVAGREEALLTVPLQLAHPPVVVVLVQHHDGVALEKRQLVRALATVVIHSHNLHVGKEGKVLFNDTLNTFYLQLYGIRHMVKDHSDSEKGNPLPPHRLLQVRKEIFYLTTHSTHFSYGYMGWTRGKGSFR